MKFRNVELTAEHEAKAIKWMSGRILYGFQLVDLVFMLNNMGYDRPGFDSNGETLINSENVSWGLAKKLIDREKKSGALNQVRRGVWRWVSGPIIELKP